jgi:predicted lipid-binding transport protein (Tim44 family)
MRKVNRCFVAALLAMALAAPALALSEADARYYDDFTATAKRIGKQLDKLGELFNRTSAGKDYSADCEDRARELADSYHSLEEAVPPGEAVTAQRDLMASAEAGAAAALELASYYDAEFTHKEKVTKALEHYEKAVDKYAEALAAAPAAVVSSP